ncbi:hypothetical protein ABEF93_006238 [Exophiala dermatitidis]
MAEGEPNAAASLGQAATAEGPIPASDVPKVDQQPEPVTGSTGLRQSNSMAPATTTTDTTNNNTMASVSAPASSGDGVGDSGGTDTNTDTVVAPAPVPLDSPLRTTPIHPFLPSIKMPARAPDNNTLNNTLDNTSVAGAGGSNGSDILNPITLRPFSASELEKYGFEKLREEINTIGTTSGTEGGRKEEKTKEIERLHNETAALIKQKLEERETKMREIEREMEEKEKTREVERKVFMKKLGSAGGGRDI